MIDDGIVIMSVGMLVVFAFLATMVVAMRLSSSFILKNFPEKEEIASAESSRSNAEVAAAIAAAYTLS